MRQSAEPALPHIFSRTGGTHAEQPAEAMRTTDEFFSLMDEQTEGIADEISILHADADIRRRTLPC
jgi:hypothetical protein